MAEKITIYITEEEEEVLKAIDDNLTIITKGLRHSRSIIIRNAIKDYYKKLEREYGKEYWFSKA